MFYPIIQVEWVNMSHTWTLILYTLMYLDVMDIAYLPNERGTQFACDTGSCKLQSALGLIK